MEYQELFFLLVVNDWSGPETHRTQFSDTRQPLNPDRKRKSSLHSLPGCFSDAAAARLGIIIIRHGMQVLLLRLPAGAPEEVPDALLPRGRGPRTHRVPAGVLTLS